MPCETASVTDAHKLLIYADDPPTLFKLKFITFIGVVVGATEPDEFERPAAYRMALIIFVESALMILLGFQVNLKLI